MKITFQKDVFYRALGWYQTQIKLQNIEVFIIQLTFFAITFFSLSCYLFSSWQWTCRLLEKKKYLFHSRALEGHLRAETVLYKTHSAPFWLNSPKWLADILGEGRHMTAYPTVSTSFLQMRKERSDPVKPVLSATAEGERLNSYGRERADCCWV